MPREDPDADEDGGHCPSEPRVALGEISLRYMGSELRATPVGEAWRRERAVSFTADAGHRTSFCFALGKNSAVTTAPINVLQVRLDSRQFLAFREPLLGRAAPAYKLSTSCVASQPRIAFWF